MLSLQLVLGLKKTKQKNLSGFSSCIWLPECPHAAIDAGLIAGRILLLSSQLSQDSLADDLDVTLHENHFLLLHFVDAVGKLLPTVVGDCAAQNCCLLVTLSMSFMILRTISSW